MAVTNSDYLQSLGKSSKTTFLAMENTKLSIEALASGAIKRGQAVKLANDGTVVAWTKADIRDLCIGYAYADAAIGDLVTIFTRGFCIVLGISTGALNAGVVCPQAYDTNTVVNGSTGYIPFAAAGGGEFNNGWSLDQAAAANALIRVLMMD